MKKIISILILTLIFIELANAQLVPSPKPQANPIEVSNINIKNSTNSLKIYYGEPAEKLIQAFGTPTSSEPFLFEMDEKIGSLYKYGQNRLLFQENKLYLFTLKSSNFIVGNGSNYIKVGDPISVLATFYPNYVLEDNTVWTTIKVGTSLIDGSLKIKTNGTSITEIVFYLD